MVSDDDIDSLLGVRIGLPQVYFIEEVFQNRPVHQLVVVVFSALILPG